MVKSGEQIIVKYREEASVPIERVNQSIDRAQRNIERRRTLASILRVRVDNAQYLMEAS